jgi:hypothetical protein
MTLLAWHAEQDCAEYVLHGSGHDAVNHWALLHVPRLDVHEPEVGVVWHQPHPMAVLVMQLLQFV